jgi:hypothetical protein
VTEIAASIRSSAKSSRSFYLPVVRQRPLCEILVSCRTQ